MTAPDPAILGAMTSPSAGPDCASVTAGELAAFGLLLERAGKALAAERERADRAEAEMAALGGRIGAVIAQAVAGERERIWQLAVRTRAACYAAEGTGHSFADLIGPEPAAKASQPDAAGTDGPAGSERVPEPPRDATRPPGTAYATAGDPAPLPRRVPGATLLDPEAAG